MDDSTRLIDKTIQSLTRQDPEPKEIQMSLLLIHTGGTIGMQKTEAGFAPGAGIVEACVQDILDSGDFKGQIDIKTLSPLIDSAEATPLDWDRLVQIIGQHHDQYDGFVVTHGTDTMAYTAAALCFALAGLQKPVVLTGSMRPLTVTDSDGRPNLVDALDAATRAEPGVWLQFSGRLMHGARVRKVHSSDLDAFRASPADVSPNRSEEYFVSHRYKNRNVSILSVAPGLPEDLFAAAINQSDGVVLRCFGSGTAPSSPGFDRALKQAQAQGVPIVAVSQCPEGGMAPGAYAAGAVLRDNGVLNGADMTVEAAYAKLHHVLSLDLSEKARLTLLATALCGEFTT